MLLIIEPQVILDKNTSLEAMDTIARRVGLAGYILSGIKFNKKFMRRIESCSLKVYTRTDLIEADSKVVRRLLPKVRKSFDVVAIKTKSAKVAQWVVKDNRVDILSIPISAAKEILTPPLANVAAQNNTFFELDLSFLWRDEAEEQNQSIALRQLSRAINILLREKTPFIFTLNVTEPFAFRDARSIVAFAEVLGIPYLQLKENYLKFQRRLQRNRKRLQEGFIAPGIWKVEATKDEPAVEIASPQSANEVLELPLALIPQSLKEKRLERQRYLLFEILSEQEHSITDQEFMTTFWKKFAKLFGEINSSRAGVYLSYYSPEERVGILRTSHKMVNAVRATFLTINKLCSMKIIIRVHKVSGTIANLLKMSKIKEKNKKQSRT